MYIISVITTSPFYHGTHLVYDQNFFLGGGRGSGWGGGSSVRCLKWGGGGRGSLMDLSKNISKQGVGKGESCLQGRGF